MRENKYRGFDPITKKFIYGNLLFTNETYYIIPFLTNGCMSQKEMMLRWISPCYQVIQETIGQFTGLHDKNGVEIYENDVVRVIALDNDHNQRGAISDLVVIYSMSNFCVSTGASLYPLCLNHTFEVIGNIRESEDK